LLARLLPAKTHRFIEVPRKRLSQAHTGTPRAPATET
jgi:hypothetical protein